MILTMQALLRQDGFRADEVEEIAEAIHDHWPARLEVCKILGKLRRAGVIVGPVGMLYRTERTVYEPGFTVGEHR